MAGLATLSVPFCEVEPKGEETGYEGTGQRFRVGPEQHGQCRPGKERGEIGRCQAVGGSPMCIGEAAR